MGDIHGLAQYEPIAVEMRVKHHPLVFFISYLCHLKRSTKKRKQNDTKLIIIVNLLFMGMNTCIRCLYHYPK